MKLRWPQNETSTEKCLWLLFQDSERPLLSYINQRTFTDTQKQRVLWSIADINMTTCFEVQLVPINNYHKLYNYYRGVFDEMVLSNKIEVFPKFMVTK